MRQRKSAFQCSAAITLCAVLLVTAQAQAETLKVGGTGAALGVMRLLGDAFEKQHPNFKVVVVEGLGSSGGRKALLGRALDVAVTSKAGKRQEKTAGTNASLLGRSPFLIAVSEKNRATNLTMKELIEIYSFKTTRWPDGSRLRLILRPLTDSDSDVLKSMSPDMESALKTAHAREGVKIAMTDEESATAIETTAGAVGSSVLALVLSEKRSVKPLAINGVTPSVKTIADGSYPWLKNFYVLTRVEPSASSQLFADFVLSAQARRLVTSLGIWIP